MEKIVASMIQHLMVEVTNAFIDRFFPQSCILQLRDEISNFWQVSGEPLHEAWLSLIRSLFNV